MNQNSLLLIVLNILNERHSSEIAITSAIITQFSGHNIVFHFEDDTKFRVDSIVSTVKIIDGSYMMNNYDYKTSENQIAIRPIGYKFLHIILLKNYSNFDRFTKNGPFSLKYVDVLLFLTVERSRDFTLWEGNMLEKAGGLFVLDTWNLSLYTVCFFCGKLTKSLRKIDGLSIVEDNRKIVVPILRTYMNKFDNFNKHVFAVGYNIYKPLYFGKVVEQVGNHSVYDGKGIERELLVILSEKLNFICLMIPFFTQKNSWAAAVNAVSKNVLDFAISGITLTLPRARIVDFTARIRTEPYSVLYSLYDDPWMSWKNILLPFEPYVWLTLAATVFLISFLLFKSGEEVSILFFITGWLRLLFEQSIPNIPSSLKKRWPVIFCMWLWFIFALVINNSYKSKLTSSIINSKAKEFDTIDELVDKGYFFQMNNFDSTVIQDNLRLSADSKFLETLRRSDNTTEYTAAILKTIGQKVAMIDEITLMQNMVQEKCRPLMSVFEQDQLRLLRDDIFPSTHAWPMQLNTPYRYRFNLVILRLQAAGLFVKWAGDFAPASQIVPRSHQRHTRLEAPSFTLASMLGPAMLWAVGMCAATLVFIGERIRPRSPSPSRSQS